MTNSQKIPLWWRVILWMIRRAGWRNYGALPPNGRGTPLPPDQQIRKLTNGHHTKPTRHENYRI